MTSSSFPVPVYAQKVRLMISVSTVTRGWMACRMEMGSAVLMLQEKDSPDELNIENERRDSL